MGKCYFVSQEVATLDELALQLFACEMYNNIAISVSPIKRCMLCKLYGNQFAILDGSPGEEGEKEIKRDFLFHLITEECLINMDQ